MGSASLVDVCHCLRSNACTCIYTSRFSMNDVTDMGRPVLVYIIYCIHQLLSERYLLHFTKLSG